MTVIGTAQAIGSGLNRPESVLALRDGRVYASDAKKGVVRVLPTPSSNADLLVPDDDFVPNGIALLSDGTFLISNIGRHGGLWRLVGAGMVEPATPPGTLPASPLGFAFPDAAGRIWVALTTTRHPRELAFKKDLRDGSIGFLDRHGGLHVCATELNFPNEVRVDPSGRWLYVTETFSRRLTRFDITRDNRLINRETVHEFGAATFPDGFEFDSKGNVWVTSVVSNRLIEVRPGEGAFVHLSESDEALLIAAEDNYQNNRFGRAEIVTGATGVLQNVSSVAFGGADLATVLLGNLTGQHLSTWHAAVSGHAPLHWQFGSTVID